MFTPRRALLAHALSTSLLIAGCSSGGGSDVIDGAPIDAASDAPTDAPTAARVVSIAGGSIGHTCALLADGTVRCWGLDDHGQLGVASASGTCTFQSMMFPCENRPIVVPGLSNVQRVALGNGQSCALETDGSVWCWGANDAAQLGLGTFDADPHAAPAMVVAHVRALAVGAFHACVILQDQTVSCWGADNYGQIGIDPAMAPQTCSVPGNDVPCATTPVHVNGLTNVAELALGRFHSCARMMDGTLKCWGLNQLGQLGIGTNDSDNHPTPTAVTIPAVATIGAGGSHTCAGTMDGRLMCWGWNDFGQLGIPAAMTPACPVGTDMPSCETSPTVVTGINAVRAVAGGRGHTCALQIDGTVLCMGRNDNGQLGAGNIGLATCMAAGDTAPCTHTPQPVTMFQSAVGIALDDFHSCAWRMDGSAACWGWNVYGQIGDGTTTDRNAPVALTF